MLPSMDSTKSIDDLFSPGVATDFFQVRDIQPFDVRTTRAFSRRNALWLSEFSRLIYRQEKSEAPNAPALPTRGEVLNPHGWFEHRAFDKNGTTAAIFRNAGIEVNNVVVVFRGTLGLRDMFTDIRVPMTKWNERGQVHAGFLNALDSVWEDIRHELQSLRVPAFFTGHSLGAALATMAAARALFDPTLMSPAALYTFGSPRVGDADFRENLRGLFHARIVNDRDIVTTVPPVVSLPFFPLYQHCGQQHRLLFDGTLEISHNDSDIAGERSRFKGVTDFIENVSGLMKLPKSGNLLPQPLIDHTPKNYTVRIQDLPQTHSAS